VPIAAASNEEDGGVSILDGSGVKKQTDKPL
jgi:hypothetical protein